MKMKNKKVEQQAARQEHLARLKEKRQQRETQPSLKREAPTRTVKPTILIVCEGKNTEPSYFNQFKLSSATIKAVGKGYNTITLVEEATRLANEGSYEQVWCVFDKDDFAANDFNNAIAMATAQGFGVGYTNQAFEYWLLLHFEDHQGAGMHRRDYHDAISEYLADSDIIYDGKGSKKVEPAFFELLMAIPEGQTRTRLQFAIQRAERNYNRLDHISPATEESSTTVFRLAKELLKYL